MRAAIHSITGDISLGQTKVGEADVPVRVQEDVLGLQVAVEGGRERGRGECQTRRKLARRECPSASRTMLRERREGGKEGWVSSPVDDVMLVQRLQRTRDLRCVQLGASLPKFALLQPEEQFAAGHVVHNLYEGGREGGREG